MVVELIYSNDCPNIGTARRRLLQAFAACGIPPRWREWEQHDPAAPAQVRTYGSPTILVNGRDVADATPAIDGAAACRVYAGANGIVDGAPSVQRISDALAIGSAGETARAAARRRPSWRRAAAALPAVGAAALPKLTCPACWPAYAGVLTSMGFGFVNYTPYLLPLTALFLSLSLFTLGWRARRRRGYGPLALGLLASALVLIGKFGFDSDTAMYVGIATLIAASAWNAWPHRRATTDSCPACES